MLYLYSPADHTIACISNLFPVCHAGVFRFLGPCARPSGDMTHNKDKDNERERRRGREKGREGGREREEKSLGGK